MSGGIFVLILGLAGGIGFLAGRSSMGIPCAHCVEGPLGDRVSKSTLKKGSPHILSLPESPVFYCKKCGSHYKLEYSKKYTDDYRKMMRLLNDEIEESTEEEEQEPLQTISLPGIFGEPNPKNLAEMTETITSWINKYPHMDVTGALTTNFCAAIMTTTEEGVKIATIDQMQKYFDAVVFDSLSRLRTDFEKPGLKWNA